MDYYKSQLDTYLDSIAPVEPSSPVDPTVPTPSPRDEVTFDGEEVLTVNDIKKNSQYTRTLRDYMIERVGVDYADKDDDQVVDDFIRRMRFFNANTVSTAGELGFITRADDRQKAIAKDAYQIYDQLGNVFVNDGVMGAVGGVGEYIMAAASDPSNYLGLLTGGLARFGAGAATVTGKQAIKATVRQAGMKAAQSGAGRQAAKEAAEEAAKKAAERAIKAGMSKRKAKGVYKAVEEKVIKDGRKALAKDAMRAKQVELFSTAAKRSLYATGGTDALFAAAQDYMVQGTLLEAGAQTEYSKTQTALSGFLGGVGVGFQLGARGASKAIGKSGLEGDTRSELDKLTEQVIEEFSPVISKKEAPKATKAILKSIRDWDLKVKKGKKGKEIVDDVDLIKTIVFGDTPGEIGGLLKLAQDKGYKPTKEVHVSDFITNVANSLTPTQLKSINSAMERAGSPLLFGELSSARVKIGDVMASRFSEAGQTLQVASQFKKMLNASVVSAAAKIEDTVGNIDSKEVAKANKMDGIKYGQSVWKRLLVSSPATTALNVAGFTQFYMGQTLADLFSSTALMTKGLTELTYNKTAAQETFRRAAAYRHIQAQKMRNLLDPYTTHDAYMKFLDENKDVQKILFETMAGGVDQTATRFGINPNNKAFQNVEAFATAANQITGVRIQDSFTKSQMFMSEMDKYLRLEKKTTLREALMSDTPIEEDVIQAALDTTLKSVFAKDYTTPDQPELIRSMAGGVEYLSNLPGIGTIIPFGRFMNNVVATAYQWSPLAAPELFFKPVFKRMSKSEPDISVLEGYSRMMVGTSALLLASQYDDERRAKGLGTYEIDAGGGTIIDAKNTYPFSAFLAAGRIVNMMRDGQDIPPELQQELGTQVAVGQLAKDLQFGNDLNNILDVLMNTSPDARGATINGLTKAAGNIVAGATRPLDAVNKLFGFATGTDNAKDVRQADGMNVFTQTSTKYVDNIFEAFIDGVDKLTEADLSSVGKKSVTGEELRTARREGPIYNPNPLAQIFGLTIKPGRTATEKAYSIAEMQQWTADERTKMPAYDKIFNSLLAPALERQTGILIRQDNFKNASLTGKRKMLKEVLKNTKTDLRKQMDDGYGGTDTVRMRLINKAARKFDKELQKEIMTAMRDRFGIEGSLQDFSFAELDIYMEYGEMLQSIYEESANFK